MLGICFPKHNFSNKKTINSLLPEILDRIDKQLSQHSIYRIRSWSNTWWECISYNPAQARSFQIESIKNINSLKTTNSLLSQILHRIDRKIAPHTLFIEYDHDHVIMMGMYFLTAAQARSFQIESINYINSLIILHDRIQGNTLTKLAEDAGTEWDTFFYRKLI